MLFIWKKIDIKKKRKKKGGHHSVLSTRTCDRYPAKLLVFWGKLFMRSCWMLQMTGLHICKRKTIDNCTWNLSLKFIEVRIFCYLMPVIGKNVISWFYAYVEHIEIQTKTVNIIHFPYLDLSQNVKIRDVPYSLKSPRNSECNLAHIYGMNKRKVFISCALYTNGYVNVNEWMLFQF